MKIYNVFILFITFIVYSVVGVFTKLASMQDFLVFAFWVYFGVLILALGTYALLWQKVLTFMPLNKAFLCKSMTIVLILAISYFVFDESITINNVIGTCLILAGLVNLSCQK